MLRRLPLLTLLAVALAALLTGALAADAPDAPAMSPAVADTTAPGLEDGVPEPEWLGCSANFDCDGGTPVACTGNTSCTVGGTGVTCDGNFHRCPDFCSVTATCECSCGTFYASCYSNKGDCMLYAKAVVCDGVFRSCIGECLRCPILP